jgi:hypothetical membrane protein
MNRVLSLAVLCLFMSLAHLAHARGPATPEEREKVVAFARLLERDPLVEDADTREWVRTWMVEVPDTRFATCPDLLGHGLGNHPYAQRLQEQALFSTAAYAVTHPNEASGDDTNQYAAGVEGASRAYEALVRARPEAKSAFMDDLVAKRNRGELGRHVRTLAREKCKRSNLDVIAAAAGMAVGLLLALVLARSRMGRKEGTRRARRATISRTVVWACAVYYTIAIVALHVLQPEFDPRVRFMSEYVFGAYGWLMTTTFFVLGLAVVTVGVGLRDVQGTLPHARIGFGLLAVGGVFVALAGVFPAGVEHLAASAIGLPSIVLAAVVLSWSFRRAPSWRTMQVPAFLISLVMLLALASTFVRVGMFGLQQRAFLALLLVWLSIVAHRLNRITAVGGMA